MVLAEGSIAQRGQAKLGMLGGIEMETSLRRRGQTRRRRAGLFPCDRCEKRRVTQARVHATDPVARELDACRAPSPVFRSRLRLLLAGIHYHSYVSRQVHSACVSYAQ